MKYNKLAIAAFTLVLGSLAQADANCPDAPQSQWMSPLEIQKKIVNEYGFAIKKFQTSGKCYEIYGWETSANGKDLQKIEVYFNPVTGAIVKKEIEK